MDKAKKLCPMQKGYEQCRGQYCAWWVTGWTDEHDYDFGGCCALFACLYEVRKLNNSLRAIKGTLIDK